MGINVAGAAVNHRAGQVTAVGWSGCVIIVLDDPTARINEHLSGLGLNRK
jgi:hypothetical protein